MNTVTKGDAYAVPSVPHTLARLSGTKFYSSIDFSGAFHCIPLTERSKEKTAFNTPYGQFQFRRMPFGGMITRKLACVEIY